MKHSCYVVFSGAGSSMCELTNQSRLGIWERGLKETGPKTERFRQNRRVAWAPEHIELVVREQNDELEKILEKKMKLKH